MKPTSTVSWPTRRSPGRPELNHDARSAGRPVSAAQRGFSLIELLVVISIIGVLAGIGAGMAGVASRKSKEARVKGELNMYVTAIESYKASFGQYPPDNSRAGTNYNPALNSLYYELAGTFTINQGKEYSTTERQATILSTVFQAVFGVQGFVNSVLPNVGTEKTQRPKNYLPTLKATQHPEVVLNKLNPTPVEILAVPVEWPRSTSFVAPLAAFTTDAKALRINPWHYVSTQPTNNPATFDLWARVVIGKQERTYGNWKE